MKLLIVNSVFLGLFLGVFCGPQQLASDWQDFKAKHGKEHPEHEEEMRMRNFAERDADIRAHNERYEAGLENFTRGHTYYSDMTAAELQKHALGHTEVEHDEAISYRPYRFPDVSVPASLDLRYMTTPARNQQNCGSCYAFAGVAYMEAVLKKKTSTSYDLSEQQILDCSYEKFDNDFNMGCEGGSAYFVLKQMMDVGVPFGYARDYPSGKSKRVYDCIPGNVSSVMPGLIHELRVFRPKTEHQLAQLLVHRREPLLISIGADEDYLPHLSSYKSGILNPPGSSSWKTNHAVLLVGFGEEKGQKFWWIKNSWGDDWGYSGFGKLARGHNTCNILGGSVFFADMSWDVRKKASASAVESLLL